MVGKKTLNLAVSLADNKQRSSLLQPFMEDVAVFPRGSRDQLVIQELAEETLIFDQRNGKAHCLNRTTALVWKLCDGQTSLAEIARKVGGGM